MSSLHQDIKDQVTQALRARNTERLDVLRGLLSSFTNEAVSKKRKPDEELSDEEALSVISRAVKQRKDSIEQFEKGDRSDLAESEKKELVILETYLPEQMSTDEVTAFLKKKQAELGMLDPSEKNRFMGIVMKELKGKADGSLVKGAVDALF
jgi:hypothetical protein